MRVPCAILLAQFAVLVGVSAETQAFAEPANIAAFTGAWAASPLTERWKVSAWGSDCGPIPQPQTVAGGAVQINQNGPELVVTGGGKTFTTASCWESYPGLGRATHSLGPPVWTSVCKTDERDPRRATVRTQVTVSEQRIVLSETGSYEFTLKNSACRASVERQRTFQRPTAAPASAVPSATPPIAGPVAAAAAPAPPSAAPVAPSEPPKRREEPVREVLPADDTDDNEPQSGATRTNSGNCVPSKLAKLRVQPNLEWAQPGTAFEMRIEAEDAAGCAITRPKLTWTVEPQGSVTFRNPRRLKVNPNASAGPIRFVARSGDVYAEASIEVVSQERFRTLLATSPSAAESVAEPLPATTPQIAAGLAVAEDLGERRKTLFALIAGGVCVFLGAFGLWLVRQGRKARADRGQSRPLADTKSSGRQLQRSEHAGRDQKSTTSLSQKKKCPRCGAEYEGTLQFCGHDGSQLVAR